MIELNDLSFRYNEDSPWVLKRVNLSLHQGEWVTIVGRNGSGKSTFAKLLNGILQPAEGHLIVNGYDTKDEQSLNDIRQIVGIVFQNPDNQFVATTVEDDIAFGLENIGLSPVVMKERIQKYAALTGISDLLSAEPHRLSGGQKQRVAIAGVAAMEPVVMVFDEATSMLDPVGRREVLKTIHTIKKQGSTVVTITHYMEEALKSDRVILIENGQVVADEQPHTFFNDADRIEAAGLAIPPLIGLQHGLRNRGIPLNRLFLEEEELMDQLWKLSSQV
ncbi:energy-coupling factor transporter ATPase [Bacillus sp. JCM 19034]|uniref:energy-coupling factor transporter ATPase n=1 Tax=Bacillus sp. JCM 19034 TaxID=1481928 RepID=UPI000784FCDA|nr:energy-coupling factor transporter ATPase [Bacillus sp. JCM 19034]